MRIRKYINIYYYNLPNAMSPNWNWFRSCNGVTICHKLIYARFFFRVSHVRTVDNNTDKKLLQRLFIFKNTFRDLRLLSFFDFSSPIISHFVNQNYNDQHHLTKHASVQDYTT